MSYAVLLFVLFPTWNSRKRLSFLCVRVQEDAITSPRSLSQDGYEGSPLGIPAFDDFPGHRSNYFLGKFDIFEEPAGNAPLGVAKQEPALARKNAAFFGTPWILEQSMEPAAALARPLYNASAHLHGTLSTAAKEQQVQAQSKEPAQTSTASGYEGKLANDSQQGREDEATQSKEQEGQQSLLEAANGSNTQVQGQEDPPAGEAGGNTQHGQASAKEDAGKEDPAAEESLANMQEQDQVSAAEGAQETMAAGGNTQEQGASVEEAGGNTQAHEEEDPAAKESPANMQEQDQVSAKEDTAKEDPAAEESLANMQEQDQVSAAEGAQETMAAGGNTQEQGVSAEEDPAAEEAGGNTQEQGTPAKEDPGAAEPEGNTQEQGTPAAAAAEDQEAAEAGGMTQEQGTPAKEDPEAAEAGGNKQDQVSAEEHEEGASKVTEPKKASKRKAPEVEPMAPPSRKRMPNKSAASSATGEDASRISGYQKRKAAAKAAREKKAKDAKKEKAVRKREMANARREADNGHAGGGGGMPKPHAEAAAKSKREHQPKSKAQPKSEPGHQPKSKAQPKSKPEHQPKSKAQPAGRKRVADDEPWTKNTLEKKLRSVTLTH